MRRKSLLFVDMEKKECYYMNVTFYKYFWGDTMAKALDVARYIIQYSNDRNYGVSNLRLQKLLYFVQAVSLAYSDQGCFEDEIEAWELGPVVPAVYREYKCYGNGSIPTSDILVADGGNIWEVRREKFNKDVLPKKTQEVVRQIVERFSQRSTTGLVDLTHNQRPWMDAHSRGEKVITRESIKEYFWS